MQSHRMRKVHNNSLGTRSLMQIILPLYGNYTAFTTVKFSFAFGEKIYHIANRSLHLIDKQQARIYHINHPAHAPLFALICKTKKNNLRPPVQPDNLNSCAPRFNIFWIRAWTDSNLTIRCIIETVPTLRQAIIETFF